MPNKRVHIFTRIATKEQIFWYNITQHSVLRIRISSYDFIITKDDTNNSQTDDDRLYQWQSMHGDDAMICFGLDVKNIANFR